jgi:hypothetical protein
MTDAEQLRQAQAARRDDATAEYVERVLQKAIPRLRAHGWRCRQEAGDGLGCWDNRTGHVRLIQSVGREADGHVWSHVSVSHPDTNWVPSWGVTRDAFRLVHPHRTGVIVVPPEEEHVNIAEVMHVWTRLTGSPLLPDFRGPGGLI